MQIRLTMKRLIEMRKEVQQLSLEHDIFIPDSSNASKEEVQRAMQEYNTIISPDGSGSTGGSTGGIVGSSTSSGTSGRTSSSTGCGTVGVVDSSVQNSTVDTSSSSTGCGTGSSTSGSTVATPGGSTGGDSTGNSTGAGTTSNATASTVGSTSPDGVTCSLPDAVMLKLLWREYLLTSVKMKSVWTSICLLKTTMGRFHSASRTVGSSLSRSDLHV